MESHGQRADRVAPILRIDVTRRELMKWTVAWTALAAITTRTVSAKANVQGPSATPVASADLDELVNLSRALTGGDVDKARAGCFFSLYETTPI